MLRRLRALVESVQNGPISFDQLEKQQGLQRRSVVDVSFDLEHQSDRNLARAIEPLASYICAADDPLDALLTALAVLVIEVKETNRAALKHFDRRRADWFKAL
jgi:hypothetical protein